MKRLMALVLTACFGMVPALQAASDYYIVKFNTEVVSLYDDNGDDQGEVSSKEASQAFSQHTVDGASVTGIKVQKIDEEEGLALIELNGKPVWVETMSVQLWPDENKLDCKDMKIVESQAGVAQSGMSIGFGDHCKE